MYKYMSYHFRQVQGGRGYWNVNYTSLIIIQSLWFQNSDTYIRSLVTNVKTLSSIFLIYRIVYCNWLYILIYLLIVLSLLNLKLDFLYDDHSYLLKKCLLFFIVSFSFIFKTADRVLVTQILTILYFFSVFTVLQQG